MFSRSCKTKDKRTLAVILLIVIGMCSESLHYFNMSFTDPENSSNSGTYSYLSSKAKIRSLKGSEEERRKAEEEELDSLNHSGRRLSRLNEVELYPKDINILSCQVVFGQYLLLICILIQISSILLVFIIYIHNQDGLKRTSLN